MSAEQRPALSHGPVYRAHYLKTERVATGALQERALRFFSNMQRVAPPSPAVLMPLFVLLCQQMTLLVKSLDKGSRKASPGIVFQVWPHAISTTRCSLLPSLTRCSAARQRQIGRAVWLHDLCTATKRSTTVRCWAPDATLQ